LTYPWLENEEWLRNAYEIKKQSLESVANQVGTSYSTLRRKMIDFGIPIRSNEDGKLAGREASSENNLLEDAELLSEMYNLEGMTLKDLAKYYNCGTATIYRYLRKHGLENKKYSDSDKLEVVDEETNSSTVQPRKQRLELLRDYDFLFKRYHEDYKLLSEIASEIGCSETQVYRWLKTHKIPKRERPTVLKKERSDRAGLMYDQEWLETQYVKLERSKSEIAQEMGIKESTVSRQLTRMGVSKRKMKSKKDWPSNPLGPGRKWAEGYIKRNMPSHPHAQRGGWILEHRVVAEEALGRYLTKEEEVHHINEKRDDNRIENLIVFPTKNDHLMFHHNPPNWMPRCPHCHKPAPEELSGRPEGVPLLWTPE
jgi:transposase